MLAILVGKSGIGKSTVEKHFEKIISFTTRPRRNGENHGLDYYFYDLEFILPEIEKYEKGEKSIVRQKSSYLEHYYGTTQEEIERILKLDFAVQVMNLEGAKYMKKLIEDEGGVAKIIWVEVDEDIRIQRLMDRMDETNEPLEKIKDRLNEDYRNAEYKECDLVIENNGTIEEFIKKLTQENTYNK